MNKIQRLQSEVENFVMGFSHTEIEEWHCDNNFCDVCGFGGYIFKSEYAANRYVLGIGLQCAMDYCNGACSDEEWIGILSKYVSKRVAKNAIKKGNWEKVVRIMLKGEGAAFFLSDYSGKIHDLENGELLYY